MNKLRLFSILILFASGLNADSRIILYLKAAPRNIITQAIRETKKDPTLRAQPTAPSKTSKKRFRGNAADILTPKLSSFFAIYSGYMDVSDRDGLISFPLRHVTPKIYIAITPEVNLIKVKENTIAHREFLPEKKDETKLYSFEKKEDVDPKDQTKKTLYWHVQEEQIPQDNKINPLTLIILSKSSNLYVPIGDFMTSESVHMVLPDIYVIGNESQNSISSQILDIRRYFESINTEDKKIDDKKSESLIKNI